MDACSILPESLLRERLEELAALYARADAAVEAFCEGSGLSCAFGCGSCCEGFVPDILPVEVALVAAQLVAKNSALAYALASGQLGATSHPGGRSGCPLYAADTPYHCTVYPARPLICRMFAFSAVRNKRGEPAYSLCSRMADSPKAPGLRSVEADSAVRFGAEPPVMADFGASLVAIDPASSSERKPLPEALAEALAKVLFLAGTRQPGQDDPDSTPTIPRAS